MKAQNFVPRTENSNPLTRDIDTWPLRKILEVMNSEDHRIAPAIAREIPNIQKAVELVVDSLSRGGRMFYVGAGTSGRLGILDAAELKPTFGLPDDRAIAIISGGKQAVFSAIEGAEDSEDDGKQALMAHSPTERDVVIGITASGRTPFVLGAMKAAAAAGAKAIAVVGDPRGPVAQYAQTTISPDVGPEVITGSTRLERYRPEDGAQYDIHRVNGRLGPDVLQPHGRYQPYKPEAYIPGQAYPQGSYRMWPR